MNFFDQYPVFSSAVLVPYIVLPALYQNGRSSNAFVVSTHFQAALIDIYSLPMFFRITAYNEVCESPTKTDIPFFIAQSTS